MLESEVLQLPAGDKVNTGYGSFQERDISYLVNFMAQDKMLRDG